MLQNTVAYVFENTACPKVPKITKVLDPMRSKTMPAFKIRQIPDIMGPMCVVPSGISSRAEYQESSESLKIPEVPKTPRVKV